MSENDYNWELDYNVGDCRLMENDGRWKEVTAIDEKTGNRAWNHIGIVDVPIASLIRQYELLVIELSMKEVKLYKLKEDYLIAEQKIINETDFKELYGKNNEKVRTNHVKSELADMVSEMKDLEFGINWIRSYIPLLKEVVRCKQ